jgi:hypothetical protein
LAKGWKRSVFVQALVGMLENDRHDGQKSHAIQKGYKFSLVRLADEMWY